MPAEELQLPKYKMKTIVVNFIFSRLCK